METKAAISVLAALAQETRITVFRLLVHTGPDGLPAGEIADRLSVPPGTLSFHLAQLERAGLLVSRRQGRLIFYAADFAAMRSLVGFLLDDCCHGRPEICEGLGEAAAAKGRVQSEKERV